MFGLEESCARGATGTPFAHVFAQFRSYAYERGRDAQPVKLRFCFTHLTVTCPQQHVEFSSNQFFGLLNRSPSCCLYPLVNVLWRDAELVCSRPQSAGLLQHRHGFPLPPCPVPHDLVVEAEECVEPTFGLPVNLFCVVAMAEAASKVEAKTGTRQCRVTQAFQGFPGQAEGRAVYLPEAVGVGGSLDFTQADANAQARRLQSMPQVS